MPVQGTDALPKRAAELTTHSESVAFVLPIKERKVGCYVPAIATSPYRLYSYLFTLLIRPTGYVRGSAAVAQGRRLAARMGWVTRPGSDA